MATAVLQAGGKSERMRRTAGPGHKALRNVLGVPLLERNLCRFLAAGFDSVVVVISEAETALDEYISNRGLQLAECRGANLRTLIEHEPLGTIGATAMLSPEDAPVLVVYSDNLTSLDFRELVETHQRHNAAMTLATHEEPFQIPFGEVVAHDHQVVDYREKSVHPIRVSSGLYVLGARALGLLNEGERVDSPDLVHRLLRENELVVNHPHNELWLDMNDATRHAALEQLIFKHPERLEWLQATPDREGRLIVERDRRLTVRVVPPDDLTDVAGSQTSGQVLGTFDEIDLADGGIVRWSVLLACELQPSIHKLSQGVQPDGYEESSKECRAIAYATAYLTSVQAVQGSLNK